MLKEKSTYEIISPETIGLVDSRMVLGKHSGRHAFREKLEEMGYTLSDEQLLPVFTKFKELCDKKKTVTDDDLMTLLEDETVVASQELFVLDYLHISCGNQAVPTATVRLSRGSDTKEEAAVGNGTVEAIYKAIDRIIGEEVELVSYQITSVSAGQDALGEVHVQIRQQDSVIGGRGSSTDVLEASAKAYLDAVNRLVLKRLSGAEVR